MVGSSWRSAEAEGDAPTRSPAWTSSVRPSAPVRADWSQAPSAAGRADRPPGRPSLPGTSWPWKSLRERSRTWAGGAGRRGRALLAAARGQQAADRASAASAAMRIR